MTKSALFTFFKEEYKGDICYGENISLRFNSARKLRKFLKRNNMARIKAKFVYVVSRHCGEDGPQIELVTRSKAQAERVLASMKQDEKETRAKGDIYGGGTWGAYLSYVSSHKAFQWFPFVRGYSN